MQMLVIYILHLHYCQHALQGSIKELFYLSAQKVAVTAICSSICAARITLCKPIKTFQKV